MSEFKSRYIHLAEAASLDGSGKLTILGIFENINFKKLPGTYLKFTVVGNVSFTKIDKDKATVEVQIIDPENKKIITDTPIQFTIELDEKNKNKSGNIGIIADIGNMQFTKEGKHQVVIMVNQNEVGREEFTIKIVKA